MILSLCLCICDCSLHAAADAASPQQSAPGLAAIVKWSPAIHAIDYLLQSPKLCFKSTIFFPMMTLSTLDPALARHGSACKVLPPYFVSFQSKVHTDQFQLLYRLCTSIVVRSFWTAPGLTSLHSISAQLVLSVSSLVQLCVVFNP